LLAFSVVVDVNVRVLVAVAVGVLCVAEATLSVNFTIASPCFVSVGADLAARIVFFGAFRDADALCGIVNGQADTTGTAVDFCAGIVWKLKGG
jgi:hypothetical protein